MQVRAVSSAVEHYVDIVGVTSSILVPPTTKYLKYNTQSEFQLFGRLQFLTVSAPCQHRRWIESKAFPVETHTPRHPLGPPAPPPEFGPAPGPSKRSNTQAALRWKCLARACPYIVARQCQRACHFSTATAAKRLPDFGNDWHVHAPPDCKRDKRNRNAAHAIAVVAVDPGPFVSAAQQIGERGNRGLRVSRSLHGDSPSAWHMAPRNQYTEVGVNCQLPPRWFPVTTVRYRLLTGHSADMAKLSSLTRSGHAPSTVTYERRRR